MTLQIKVDNVYKMIGSRIFNYRVDVKFPCFKLTLTSVWPWHDSINQLSLISHLYFESKVNSMKL